MVYYFAMQCEDKIGNIITYPINKLLILFLKGYNEEKTKKAVKNSQMIDIYVAAVLKFALVWPIWGLLLIADTILQKYFEITFDRNTQTIVLIIVALIVCFPIFNYLFGKKDRYLKYFNEFDNKFQKCPNYKKYLYGISSVLFVLLLFSSFYFASMIAEFIEYK